MARRGSSRRTYVRDANGRFASTPGGGGPKRPATKAVKRGPNRLTRDNAGRITSQGGDGATVRGGRLKTAAGNLRGRQVAKLKTMQGVSYGKPRPNNSAATTLAATTKNASNNKDLTTKKASKKPAKKVKFQMTEADARKFGTFEAGKPILDVIKTDKTLRKLQRINEPKSPAQKLKRSEKLDKAFASGISTAKMAKAPRPEWMPNFAGNRLREVQSAPNTPFYQHMLFKTGRAQSGPLRPGLGKRLKTMQGVSYEKSTPKALAASAQKQANKASPKNVLNSPFRPGEFYRGNFRPRNVTGKPQKSSKIYGTNKDNNIETTLGLASKTKRFSLANLQKKKRNIIASVSFPPPANTPNLNINTSNKWYKNPTKEQREMRRSGFSSTSDPRGVVFHEAAHAKYGHRGKQRWSGGKNNAFAMIAKRVSQYAATNPNEFVAEVYAGRKTGRKYDHQVMRVFRLYTKNVYEKKGSSPLLIKNQKPIRRKRKP